jgi:hypothetical protein
VAARVTAFVLPTEGERASICAGFEKSPATSLVRTASKPLAIGISAFARTLANKGIEIARLRMACAVPGEQLSQFSEALRRLGENAAYLYSLGENYWF